MIHLFYCSNSLSEDETRQLGAQFGTDELRMLSLPCSGKITIPYLVKAFENGADGVALCCCSGTECRNLEGNLRASKRTEAVNALMEEVGLGRNCVLTIAKGEGGIEQLIEDIERFRTGLRTAPVPGRVTVARKESTSAAHTRRENAA